MTISVDRGDLVIKMVDVVIVIILRVIGGEVMVFIRVERIF